MSVACTALCRWRHVFFGGAAIRMHVDAGRHDLHPAVARATRGTYYGPVSPRPTHTQAHANTFSAFCPSLSLFVKGFSDAGLCTRRRTRFTIAPKLPLSPPFPCLFLQAAGRQRHCLWVSCDACLMMAVRGLV